MQQRVVHNHCPFAPVSTHHPLRSNYIAPGLTAKDALHLAEQEGVRCAPPRSKRLTACQMSECIAAFTIASAHTYCKDYSARSSFLRGEAPCPRSFAPKWASCMLADCSRNRLYSTLSHTLIWVIVYYSVLLAALLLGGQAAQVRKGLSLRVVSLAHPRIPVLGAPKHYLRVLVCMNVGPTVALAPWRSVTTNSCMARRTPSSAPALSKARALPLFANMQS